MTKELLILGVDPGSTVAYAVMNLDGKLLDVGSSKKLTLNSLIFKMMKRGRIVVVGTDVNPPPAFVKKVATAFGATLAFPEENIWTKHKGEMVKGYKVVNKHEKDALVAALVAFNQIKPVLDKIKRLLKKKGKREFEEEIRKILLTKKHVSVDRAVRMLDVD